VVLTQLNIKVGGSKVVLGIAVTLDHSVDRLGQSRPS